MLATEGWGAPLGSGPPEYGWGASLPQQGWVPGLTPPPQRQPLTSSLASRQRRTMTALQGGAAATYVSGADAHRASASRSSSTFGERGRGRQAVPQAVMWENGTMPTQMQPQQRPPPLQQAMRQNWGNPSQAAGLLSQQWPPAEQEGPPIPQPQQQGPPPQEEEGTAQTVQTQAESLMSVPVTPQQEEGPLPPPRTSDRETWGASGAAAASGRSGRGRRAARAGGAYDYYREGNVARAAIAKGPASDDGGSTMEPFWGRAGRDDDDGDA